MSLEVSEPLQPAPRASYGDFYPHTFVIRRGFPVPNRVTLQVVGTTNPVNKSTGATTGQESEIKASRAARSESQ